MAVDKHNNKPNKASNQALSVIIFIEQITTQSKNKYENTLN